MINKQQTSRIFSGKLFLKLIKTLIAKPQRKQKALPILY